VSVTIATPERKRLAAILGMLGSNSPGERDNAARMAESFRRLHNLTWDELVTLPPEAIPEPVKPAPPAPEPKVTPRPASRRPWVAPPMSRVKRALIPALSILCACVWFVVIVGAILHR
jgi:hypothetical protein